jgi:hypothetical protein
MCGSWPVVVPAGGVGAAFVPAVPGGRRDRSRGFDEAVLSVAGPSCSLPRAISADAVCLLLSGCDPGSAAGRRDYAILLLLARLGLRGGEVVAMGWATSTGALAS